MLCLWNFRKSNDIQVSELEYELFPKEL